MAMIERDYEWEHGKELLDKLEGEDALLIKYYVQKQNEYIEELQKKIKEMNEVFSGISRYTNRSPYNY